MKYLSPKAIIRLIPAATRWRIGVVLLAILGTSCANQEEESLQPQADLATDPDSTSQGNLELARVGDRSITAGQLQAFYGKIPNYLQSDREGLEKERNHLQTLIDMELLQLEAKEQGIDRLPAFIYKIAQYRKEKLVGLYQIKKIRVRVSGQEVSDYFREQGWRARSALPNSSPPAQTALGQHCARSTRGVISAQ